MKDRNFGRRSASLARMQCRKIKEVYILYACRISADCHADQMKVNYDAFLFPSRKPTSRGFLEAKTDVVGLYTQSTRSNHNVPAAHALAV